MQNPQGMLTANDGMHKKPSPPQELEGPPRAAMMSEGQPDRHPVQIEGPMSNTTCAMWHSKMSQSVSPYRPDSPSTFRLAGRPRSCVCRPRRRCRYAQSNSCAVGRRHTPAYP